MGVNEELCKNGGVPTFIRYFCRHHRDSPKSTYELEESFRRISPTLGDIYKLVLCVEISATSIVVQYAFSRGDRDRRNCTIVAQE